MRPRAVKVEDPPAPASPPAPVCAGTQLHDADHNPVAGAPGAHSPGAPGRRLPPPQEPQHRVQQRSTIDMWSIGNPEGGVLSLLPSWEKARACPELAEGMRWHRDEETQRPASTERHPHPSPRIEYGAGSLPSRERGHRGAPSPHVIPNTPSPHVIPSAARNLRPSILRAMFAPQPGSRAGDSPTPSPSMGEGRGEGDPPRRQAKSLRPHVTPSAPPPHVTPSAPQPHVIPSAARNLRPSILRAMFAPQPGLRAEALDSSSLRSSE